MNKRRLATLGGVVLALGMLALSLAFFYTAYRRVHNPVRFTQESITVQGVVMGKLVEEESDRFLPFPVTSYVVRYAFPSAQGRMRTGQQVVTRAFYQRLAGQGHLAWIVVSVEDPRFHAIDPRLTFPSTAGWRLGIGLAFLVASFFIAMSSVSGLRAKAATS
jgi:hypothetical protein